METKSKTKKRIPVKITPIESLKGLPDAIAGEDAFTPITGDNAYIEEFRRFCLGYGISQDLKRGCNYCMFQLRCLNVMRLNVPIAIEHFREKHFNSNPFLGEAVNAATEENINLVISYSLEDIGEYQEEGDALSKDRVLALLGIYAKDILKSIDPRYPVLLLERLLQEEDLTTIGEGPDKVYVLKSNLPF